mmetsp:Transcript_3048/g.5624  ORF Transcript_3048/g.5624 Transcript_3048/m.5624 type:complete len:84 (-) Transcript_3048:76-327(-)
MPPWGNPGGLAWPSKALNGCIRPKGIHLELYLSKKVSLIHAWQAIRPPPLPFAMAGPRLGHRLCLYILYCAAEPSFLDMMHSL